jgi:hypothetical protein
MSQTPNQAQKQTAEHDSFFQTTALRWPAAAELVRYCTRRACSARTGLNMILPSKARSDYTLRDT